MDDDVWEDDDFLKDLLNAEKNIICSINPNNNNLHSHSSNFSPPRQLFSLSQNPTQPQPQPPSNGVFSSSSFSNQPQHGISISPFQPHIEPPPPPPPRLPPTKSAPPTTLYPTSNSRQQVHQDTEVDRLKSGLHRLSQDLLHLEKQREELLKDKAKIEEQLGFVSFPVIANPNNANGKQATGLPDRLQISPQFQNASTSIPQDGLEYPVFEAKDNCRNVLERPERPTGQKSYTSYGRNGENMQVDGESVTTDLKRRILTDNASTTSSDHHIQKIVLPETTAKPKCTKAVGVQTDADDTSGYSSATGNWQSQRDLLNKFSSIWGLTSTQRAGKNLASKLFLTCAADIYALFRCLGMSMPSTLDSFACLPTPDVVLHDKLQHVGSVEAAKVAHLYSILTKIDSGMVQLDVLVDALIDLCTLKNVNEKRQREEEEEAKSRLGMQLTQEPANAKMARDINNEVVIVHRSLRIVHVFLQYVMSWDERPNQRDNVVIESVDSKNKNVAVCKSGELHAGIQFGLSRNGTSFTGNDFSGVKPFNLTFGNEERGRPGNEAFISTIDWFLLFETMHSVALGNKEECIQVEAISVMNLILMRSNPFSEREKFGTMKLFESLSRLLRKDVGLQVQKQAVHLLFLLLNCPKILVLFCSGCKEDASFEAAADSTKDASAFRGFNSILEGLAECVTSSRQHLQELNLRRLSIKVLSFIASSGKSGFEVFLNQKVSKGGSFLELIMQTLASEMDADTVESTEPSETCKERTSLIREALILLNRLASSPAYSAAVLQVLASSRIFFHLSRLSRKGTDMQKFNNSKKRKAEDEIIDLARVFRSRVFAYLEKVSS